MVTDPVPARQPWISAGRFHDIDAQAAQYHGYGQQYQQLSRGPFEGRLSSFNFGADLVINLETANREIAASAATPPDVMVPASSPRCPRLARSMPRTSHRLMLY